MATSIEKLSSRTGNTTGLFGAQNFSRTFNVEMDAVGDDPIATLAALSPNANGVSVGSPHPDDASQVALRFIRVAAMTKTYMEVRVEYGLPLVINSPSGENSGWSLSTDHALETETVVYDINGNPMGGGAYHPVPETIDDDPDSPSFGEPIASDPDAVARLKLRYPSIDVDKEYQALGQLASDSGIRPIKLFRIVNSQRTQPGTRTKKVTTFTISQTFPSLTISERSRLDFSMNTVNSNTFFGAPIGTLKVLDAHTADRSGTMAGQAIPGIIFDVAITFQSRPDDGHNNQKQFHTFIDNFGNESVVKLSDVAQFDEHDQYQFSSFSFSSNGQFQATTPLQRIQGRRVP